MPPTVTPRILRAMSERQAEFTNFKPVRVAVGTWNVNGGKQFRSNLLGTAELAGWLLDAPMFSGVSGSQGERGRDRVTGADPWPRPPSHLVRRWTWEVGYLAFSLLGMFRKLCGKLDHRHFFFFLAAACRILVSRPGIEPRPSAAKVWSPNHWTARELIPCVPFKNKTIPRLTPHLLSYIVQGNI